MILDRDTGTGVLRVEGTLDIETANSLRETLLDCLARGPELRADLSAAEGCDAAALQVLLAGLRDASAAGKNFGFTAISGAVRETATALGFVLPETCHEHEEERAHAG